MNVTLQVESTSVEITAVGTMDISTAGYTRITTETTPTTHAAIPTVVTTESVPLNTEARYNTELVTTSFNTEARSTSELDTTSADILPDDEGTPSITQPQDSNSFNPIVIGGAVAGTVVLLLFIVVLVISILYFKRSKGNKNASKTSVPIKDRPTSTSSQGSKKPPPSWLTLSEHEHHNRPKIRNSMFEDKQDDPPYVNFQVVARTRKISDSSMSNHVPMASEHVIVNETTSIQNNMSGVDTGATKSNPKINYEVVERARKISESSMSNHVPMSSEHVIVSETTSMPQNMLGGGTGANASYVNLKDLENQRSVNNTVANIESQENNLQYTENGEGTPQKVFRKKLLKKPSYADLPDITDFNAKMIELKQLKKLSSSSNGPVHEETEFDRTHDGCSFNNGKKTSWTSSNEGSMSQNENIEVEALYTRSPPLHPVNQTHLCNAPKPYNPSSKIPYQSSINAPGSINRSQPKRYNNSYINVPDHNTNVNISKLTDLVDNNSFSDNCIDNLSDNKRYS